MFRDDDEAARLWVSETGVPAERVTRMGEKSNFWAMGDTGPCGPCSEIFYDHGPEVPADRRARPMKTAIVTSRSGTWCSCSSSARPPAKLTPLPKPSVDTGAGLERLAAVMQGVHSNYDIDLFQRSAQGGRRAATQATDLGSPSLRVIADHIRACSFLISDGVVPSNEGRGYVLRRIIRRAVRHGYKLGQSQSFFYKLVPVLAQVMGDAYPELRERSRADRARAARGGRALRRDAGIGHGAVRGAHARGRGQHGARAAAVPAARYLRFSARSDRRHCPRARPAGRSRGLRARDGAAARTRARGQQVQRRSRAGEGIDAKSEFLGYESTRGRGSGGGAATRRSACAGAQARASWAKSCSRARRSMPSPAARWATPARLAGAGGARFAVADTQKLGGAIVHIGALSGAPLRVGDTVQASVDGARRAAIRLNHSATHLLHAALRKVLGTHVTQKGSLVAPDRLRFDFSHFQPVSAEELAQIERLVNAEIRANAEARTRLMDYEHAVATGAMALFGEKYDREVRVLNFGEFSTELCGGTHVGRTGDIGLFRILSESGVAAGVRRIEAVTGEGALEAIARSEAVLRDVGGLLRGNRDELADKVREMLERMRDQEREIRALKDKLALGPGYGPGGRRRGCRWHQGDRRARGGR